MNKMNRFLGNKDSDNMEVHDLENRQVNCQISEIKPEHRAWFNPDTLEEAHQQGFDNCKWCIGNSRR